MSIIISLERIKERRKKLTQTNVSVAFPIFIFRIWHTFGEQGGGRGKEGGEGGLNLSTVCSVFDWGPGSLQAQSCFQSFRFRTD